MGIKREAMLVLVDTTNNNNKFYHVTLDDSGVVTKEWGRVGNSGQSSTETSGDAGFERAIKAKEKKGYKQTSIVGSAPIATSGGNSPKLEVIAKKFLAKRDDDDVIVRLIERLVAANAHQIMAASGGMIKVADDGQIKTALGLVDDNTIRSAERILADIHKQSGLSRSRITLLEEYLTLIPQKVSSKRGWHEDYLDAKNLAGQVDFLKQLKDSYDWSKKTTAAVKADKDEPEEDFSSLFRMKLDRVENASIEFKTLEKRFNDTRNSIHQSRNLRLLNVFAVEDLPTHQEAYAKIAKELGNEKQLWHGTKAANVLSILTKGFYVPPVRGSTVQVTGRMFGDGVYFSEQSTKALNYASGYWSGQRTNSNCFMFMNDVVMGNEYRPARPGNMSEAYTGKSHRGAYNSINVKAGTASVMNHEAIIWNTPQIAVRYLCEFGA